MSIYVFNVLLVKNIWTTKITDVIPFKGIQAVRMEFFVYIKSCQYSMFYTKTKNVLNKKPGLKNLL